MKVSWMTESKSVEMNWVMVTVEGKYHSSGGHKTGDTLNVSRLCIPLDLDFCWRDPLCLIFPVEVFVTWRHPLGLVTLVEVSVAKFGFHSTGAIKVVKD